MMLEEYGRSGITRLAEEWIVGKNARRDREILLARFLDGLTYEQLAEAFDLSVSQVKRIVYRTESIVYQHAKDEAK